MTDNTKKDLSTLIEELSISLADELYIEPEEIDVEMNFTDMGLDSIIGVEWIRSLNKKYGTSISTAKIYQYSNLIEFAKYGLSELNKSASNADSETNIKEQKTSETVETQSVDSEQASADDNVQNGADTSVSDEEYEKLVEELVKSLADELFLSVEEIDVEASFLELGLDSIIGVEWIRSINKKYGTSISTTKIYQYPDIKSFAAYLYKVIYGDNGTKSTVSEAQKNETELKDVDNTNVDAKDQKHDEGDEDKALDDLLWAVYQGDTNPDDAAKLLDDLDEGE